MSTQSEAEEDDTSHDSSGEESEEDEPKLKYLPLTKRLTSTYRNGDATSAFLAVGDKIIIGTHNGNVHIFTIPGLRPLRSYRVQNASITDISVQDRYVATSCLDGSVCVASMTDPKDAMLRSFGRPVQAVALSSDFKNDRSYLSGGLAGNLVLTTGGKAGTSSKSSTSTGNMTSPGWLGSLGLSSAAKDTILHSGEGTINTIRWSTTGKYVAWINEKGIKVMAHEDWKRVTHIDRPQGAEWDEMCNSWRGKIVWTVGQDESLMVGWGDALWIVKVYSRDRAKLVQLLRTDCTIAGIALYSQTMLLMLAYKANTPSGTRRQRQGASQPELRLIDLESSEQVSTDTLVLSRYESLTSSDYHMGQLDIRQEVAKAPRFNLDGLGAGFLGAGFNVLTSAASIRSGSGSEDVSRRSELASSVPVQAGELGSIGLKTFVVSPYDCILVTKRDISDHLSWLLEMMRYDEAWQLVNDSPEIVSAEPVTPTGIGTNLNSAAEKEKRRIGELWIQQLIDDGDWKRASSICGKVLATASRWEHWFWVFANAKKIPEISPYLPAKLSPPLSSTVYDVTLGYFIAHDRTKLPGLLERWSALFDVTTVIDAIKTKLSQDLSSDDWAVLADSLATLLVANNQPRDALPYYLQLKDADNVTHLVREYHLLNAIDDISSFVMLQVSKEDEMSASVESLESLTSEAIELILQETRRGTVMADTTIEQLQQSNRILYLFFFLKALWTKDTGVGERAMLEQHADLAVKLFAEYDRGLLMDLLKVSQAYTFDQATDVCARNEYIPELVYLLSKTGQMKRALFLIIDRLHDVSQAISFAKQQNDRDLWDDLLEYSMDKPNFIRGLLEEVGTSIDPITLVRRIPEGLEIEGLREGLSKMLRDYEIQWSISDGVATVLRGEVSIAMQKLRTGQRKALRFDANSRGFKCSQCNETLSDEDETLVGFVCRHVWHLGCLTSHGESEINTSIRSVAAKVTRAHLLKDSLQGGCPHPSHKESLTF